MSRDGLEQLLVEMSGPGMMAHLREFDRWTKHAGTQEELESLAYVQACLDNYGYQTELVLHDAYISLPKRAEVSVAGRPLRAITHSFGCSTPPDGLSGALAYVGSGGDDEFASKDVHGCIVIVDGIASPAVSQRASRAGAVAQLHVSPHEHLHEMCISPVWGSPTHESRSNLPSTAVVTIPLEDGEKLKRDLLSGSAPKVSILTEVDTGWRKTPILIAELAGPTGAPDEPFVFFTGHHDTWYYGVMDNGGANATMLEVARLCAEQRGAWKRGLRVVFWSGHSQGRYSSSTWYADAHWEELEARAVAHVNVDSTGGKGNTVVADTTAAAELSGLAREALERQAGQQFSGRRMHRAGDQSFWGIGIPAIFGNMSEQPASGETNASAAVFGGGRRVGHGTGWWWHTPADTLDKMDEDILVRDTRIYLEVVWRLLTEPVLPLDYVEHGRYLQRAISDLAEKAGPALDVGQLLERAGALTRKAERLAEVRAAAGTPDRVAEVNRCLMALSRVLVQNDYTAVDRFEQDPAINAGPLRALQPSARLSALDPDSDEFKFLLVGMTRAKNKVAWALKIANDLLDQFLDADAAGWK